MVEVDNQTLPPRVYEQLALCTKCFQLTGPVLSREPRPAEHKIVWSPVEGTRKVQVQGSGDLPDFQMYCDCECTSGAYPPLDYRRIWPDRSETGALYELCFSCALELRDVSSKWSLVVCRACLPVLQHANEFAGRWLFPVGWHSIVNSAAAGRIHPAPQSPKDVLANPEELIALAQAQKAGLERMQQWRRKATMLNLRASGMLDGTPPARVPLSMLFAASESAKYQRDLRAVQLVQSTRPWTAPVATPLPVNRAVSEPEIPVPRSRWSLLNVLLPGPGAALRRALKAGRKGCSP